MLTILMQNGVEAIGTAFDGIYLILWTDVAKHSRWIEASGLEHEIFYCHPIENHFKKHFSWLEIEKYCAWAD